MGQVQSRQNEESFFKLDANDKEALLKKYTELATSAKGGKVLETTDELFGEGSHLIKEEPATEDKNRETATGFWKDGWETKRHNKGTHHTAIIQLACPGTIAGFDIDTAFFDGSHPAYASIEACLVAKGVNDEYKWEEVLPKVPLNGNSHHYYGIKSSDDVYTHIKLNMYPDGGIARLRVYGNVSPVFPDEKTVFDLACLSNGGKVIKTSDDCYGKPSNLILPTAGTNARDGWQTRRSRVDGHEDWVEIKLGATGLLESLEVDTTHFHGNSPDFISLDACKSEYNDVQYDPEVNWVSLLSKSEVKADKKNVYSLKIDREAYSHVRLHIYPDGGISRLRVYGVRVPEVVEEPIVLKVTEEKIVKAIDELKVGESTSQKPTESLIEASVSESTETTTTTLVETEEVTKEVTKETTKESGNVALVSEISSVTTLVEEEAELVKKVPAKRGRAKAAANVAVAAAKLTTKKKPKRRSATEPDEEDEASETSATSAPRSKKARE